MKRIQTFLLFLLVLSGCRDRYELPLRDNDVSLLVVEGVLNVSGPTTISLSRSVKVNATVSFQPELNAQVTMEDKNGGTFPLTASGAGKYGHPQLPMTIGQEYRLRIRSSANKEYVSDYVVASQTPPIDSISWKKDSKGLTVYANSHDPSNNTRYYQWSYDETWEILSRYPAEYKWTGGTTIIYTGLQNYRCWKYSRSTNILIGSTAQLQADVLKEALLVFIANGSEKLGVRYSILVKQQSLTKAAYEYLTMMKKNTESIGTIFDPQPAELRGNIRGVTDPNEVAIGYLTATSFSEKRLFITAFEADWRYIMDCSSVEVDNHPDSIAVLVPSYLPYTATQMAGLIVSYSMGTSRCVDCTERGGDLAKPSYW